MTEPQTTQTPAVTVGHVPCDVHGCTRDAIEVLKFREQPGHVHVCGPCGAEDREFCDVSWPGPLPCPWPETDGVSWVGKPRELS